MRGMDKQKLEWFKREIIVSRGNSERTAACYEAEIKAHLNWMQKQKITIKRMKRKHFVDWRETIMSRKPAGVNVAIVAVRSFYEFLVDQEYLNASCFPKKMRVKLKIQAPPDVPSAAAFLEIREKLKIPSTDPRAIGQRIIEAVIETLAGSGLRISALLSIRPRHVRLDGNPHLMIEAGDVDCKGTRAGIVPLSPYAAKILGSFLADNGIPDQPIFQLSGSVVRKILRKLSPPGLKLKPHSLRHFFCAMTYFKNFEGNKFDPVWVRDAAGHSNISITDNYLTLAKQICTSDEDWDAWANGKEVQAEASKSA